MLASLIPFPYRLAALMALCAALFAFGFLQGARHEQDKNAGDELAAVGRVVTIERKQAATSAAIEAKAVQADSQARVVYRTINHEVIRYVSSPHAACSVGADWLRIYNAAALSEVPDATGRADGTAATATTDQVLTNATENYDACNEAIRRLVGLQAWGTALAALDRQ